MPAGRTRFGKGSAICLRSVMPCHVGWYNRRKPPMVPIQAAPQMLIGRVAVSALHVAAERRARWCAAAHFLADAILIGAVGTRMVAAPETFYAGALLIGPLAYFGAFFAVLFCFLRELPRWASRIVPGNVHAEYRDLFGLPKRR